MPYLAMLNPLKKVLDPDPKAVDFWNLVRSSLSVGKIFAKIRLVAFT